MSGISRRGVVAGAAGATVWPLLGARAAQAEERPFRADAGKGKDGDGQPNVLVILADDLGWADLGCYGSPHIRTPVLDGLAAEGVRFTDAYSASTVCSPTRFALYTGRYPGRLPGGLAEPIGGPNERDGIPAGHPTLASLLKEAGYATAMFGKWHCGHLPWFSPVKSGWDSFFGNLSGAVDYYSKISRNGHDLYEGEVPAESLDYYTDTIADRAAGFITGQGDRPWLLNLNFNAPHWPWEAPGDLETSKEITARIKAGDLAALSHTDGGAIPTYARMVQAMDAAIGRVLRALRDSGREGRTLVVFASDNGGERWSYLWPLSGGKGDLKEGGIRVPTIARWPDRIRPGQVSAVPVATQDWTATILDAAGASPAAGHPLDGHSLIPYLLEGAGPPQHPLFWRTRRSRALRSGDWKYLRHSGTTDALYEVTSDPRERANLAARRPEVLQRLRSTWEEIDKGLLPYPEQGRD